MSKRNPCPQTVPMGRDTLQISDLLFCFLCDYVWGIWIATLLPSSTPPPTSPTCKDAWVICKDLPGLWLDTLYFRGDKE